MTLAWRIAGAQGIHQLSQYVCTTSSHHGHQGRPATQLSACPQGATNSPGSALEATQSMLLVMQMADEATTAVSSPELLVSFR